MNWSIQSSPHKKLCLRTWHIIDYFLKKVKKKEKERDYRSGNNKK